MAQSIACGTGDLVANVLAISNSMRQFLETLNQGNGILAELIKGPANPQEKRQFASTHLHGKFVSIQRFGLEAAADD